MGKLAQHTGAATPWHRTKVPVKKHGAHDPAAEPCAPWMSPAGVAADYSVRWPPVAGAWAPFWVRSR